MKPQYLRAFSAGPIRADDPEAPIRFIASTEGVGRDGLIIRQDGWQLDNYRKNPVVLWAHDYGGTNLPIGRADVSVEGKNLIADVTFDAADPFAAQVRSKYERGFLNAVSVGWRDHEVKPSSNGSPPEVVSSELLDISGVPVPGDPDALKERQLIGVRGVAQELADLLKVSIDGATEPEGSRAGAVLNSRNREKLSQAASLINEVLRTAEKEEPERSEPSPDLVWEGLIDQFRNIQFPKEKEEV